MNWRDCLNVILTITLILLIAFIPVKADASSSIYAKNGEIQLEGWNFVTDGSIELKGKWSFYWRELFQPSDFIWDTPPQVDSYVEIPSYWFDYTVNDRSPPPIGYATYRITISGLQADAHLAIMLRNVYSSYTIWANHTLVTSVGHPASTEEETIEKYGFSSVLPVSADSNGHLTLLIQVANYSYPKGGINNTILLGDVKQLQYEKSKSVAVESFMIGAILIMAIYHLVLYGLRRKERTPLYFGLFCICIAVRTMLVETRFLLEVVPTISFEWFSKLSYLTVYVGEFFLISFIYYLFPQYLSRFVWRTTQLITLTLTLIVIFTPIVIFDKTLLFFEVYSIALVLYAVYAAIRATRQRQEGAVFLILGFILLLITALNDILNRKGIVSTPPLLQFGVLGFIFLQSVLLSKRFSYAFIQVERLSERLLALDKLKDEFLAKTSHDLRTPLHGIIGLTESLIDGHSGKLAPSVIELLRLIKISGQRLAHLINDILDFSKLKHQEIALVKVTINLRLAIELTLTILRPLANKKGLSLSNQVEGDLHVSADENRLQQILHNLIGNAIAYTEVGSVTIAAKQLHEYTIIEIMDTGTGIAETDQARIFESFEQVDPTTQSQQSGTGIGLSITKKLIELHGGMIDLESKFGQGSTFRFTLPRAEMSNLSSTTNAPVIDATQHASFEWQNNQVLGSEESTALKMPLASVLIVDDDPINVQVLVQFLGGRYNLRSTCSGQEAIHWIQSGYKPDVALLDVMMPYVSGLQVSEEIRRFFNSGELPIIFLSAKSQSTDFVAAFEYGGNDYLVKPVDKDELLARLELHVQLAHWNASLEREVEVRTMELEHSLDERASAMAEVSVLAERNRIARDIHDHVGHILTASVVQLEAGMKLLAMQKSESIDKLQVASELVRKGLHEMRKSVHMLAEEAVMKPAFRDSLLQIIEDSEHFAEVKFEHRIEVSVDSLDPEMEKIIRHALQEGITNGIRHGQCTHFRFELTETLDDIRFLLENNGLPYETERLGFGLTMIRQTALRRGGTFQIGTIDRVGCKLAMTIPRTRSEI